MTENKQVGRLALRVEGDWWVAYYNRSETSIDEIELGRVRVEIVRSQAHKTSFMALMREAVSKPVPGLTGGIDAFWKESPKSLELRRGS